MDVFADDDSLEEGETPDLNQLPIVTITERSVSDEIGPLGVPGQASPKPDTQSSMETSPQSNSNLERNVSVDAQLLLNVKHKKEIEAMRKEAVDLQLKLNEYIVDNQVLEEKIFKMKEESVHGTALLEPKELYSPSNVSTEEPEWIKPAPTSHTSLSDPTPTPNPTPLVPPSQSNPTPDVNSINKSNENIKGNEYEPLDPGMEIRLDSIPPNLFEGDLLSYFSKLPLLSNPKKNVSVSSVSIFDHKGGGRKGHLVCSDWPSVKTVLQSEFHTIKGAKIRVFQVREKKPKESSSSDSRSRERNPRKKPKRTRSPASDSSPKKRKYPSRSSSRSSSRSRSSRSRSSRSYSRSSRSPSRKRSYRSKSPDCKHPSYTYLSYTTPEFQEEDEVLCSLCKKTQVKFIWKCDQCKDLFCSNCKSRTEKPPQENCQHDRGYYTDGVADKKTNIANPLFRGKCCLCGHQQKKATWNCSICHKPFCKECSTVVFQDSGKPPIGLFSKDPPKVKPSSVESVAYVDTNRRKPPPKNVHK